MSIKKVSKEQPDKFEFSDENLNLAKKIVYYVDTSNKVIGVLNTIEDMSKANSSSVIRALKNKYKYHIQMVNAALI